MQKSAQTYENKEVERGTRWQTLKVGQAGTPGTFRKSAFFAQTAREGAEV